jgi:hypothetical protein
MFYVRKELSWKAGMGVRAYNFSYSESKERRIMWSNSRAGEAKLSRLSKIKIKKTRGIAQMVEHLSSKQETPRSIFSTAKNKIKYLGWQANIFIWTILGITKYLCEQNRLQNNMDFFVINHEGIIFFKKGVQYPPIPPQRTSKLAGI